MRRREREQRAREERARRRRGRALGGRCAALRGGGGAESGRDERRSRLAQPEHREREAKEDRDEGGDASEGGQHVGRRVVGEQVGFRHVAKRRVPVGKREGGAVVSTCMLGERETPNVAYPSRIIPR